jgi:hypothetical protein
LYRYGADEAGGGKEVPLDEHYHALAALRYLVSKLDARHMARPRGPKAAPEEQRDLEAEREALFNRQEAWRPLW